MSKAKGQKNKSLIISGFEFLWEPVSEVCTVLNVSVCNWVLKKSSIADFQFRNKTLQLKNNYH